MQAEQYTAFVKFFEKAARARGESEEKKETQVFLLGTMVLKREPAPATDEERAERVKEVEAKASEAASMMALLGKLGGDDALVRLSGLFAMMAGMAAIANVVADAEGVDDEDEALIDFEGDVEDESA